MYKEKYTRAEMEVIEFDCEDVIITSDGDILQDDDELEIMPG